ncbi:MAG TPA: molybdenum cofactor guanylyltransferase [Oscillospiraceae bacterium]|nr:molybdenum cofactor guanylyltransferase [Oscillospiraceae bacterium]
MTAVILAGGKSSRMGQNKLFLPLGEQPVIGNLISRLQGKFAQLLVVTDEPDLYGGFPVKVVSDEIICPVKNSLTGIHAGLKYAQTPYSLLVAGDMPFVHPAVVDYLCRQAKNFDVIVPQEGHYFQPLCAVYHQNCISPIEQQLAQENYRIVGFFKYVRVQAIAMDKLMSLDPTGLTFFNINTPDDYQRAQSLLNCGIISEAKQKED